MLRVGRLWACLFAALCLGAIFANFARQVRADHLIHQWDEQRTAELCASVRQDKQTYAAWSTVSFFGDKIFLAVASAVVAGVLVQRRERTPAVIVIVSALATAALIWYLKDVYGRERPPTASKRSGSFPSGHTTWSIVFYGLLIYLTPYYLTRDKLRQWFLAFVSVVFLFTIPMSRVLLGEHYPTDVFGGVMLGITMLTGTLGFLEADRLCRHTPQADTLATPPAMEPPPSPAVVAPDAQTSADVRAAQ